MNRRMGSISGLRNNDRYCRLVIRCSSKSCLRDYNVHRVLHTAVVRRLWI